MQIERLVLTLVSLLSLLGGCGMITESPIQAEDIRLCSDANTTTRVVRGMAEQQHLRFHYGTHTTDYGTQTTFRLIGRGFELELFNSMSQDDYTLRVYQADGGDERTAVSAFARFKDEIRTRLGAACKA